MFTCVFYIIIYKYIYIYIYKRRRWVDNIKIDLREIGWDGVDWVYLAQDRSRGLVNTVMNLRVP
jgi:hypothetical protein